MGSQRKLMVMALLLLAVPASQALDTQNPRPKGSLLNPDFRRTATVVKVLQEIKLGADVNAKDDGGLSVLHFAAANSSNAEVIRLLLEQGADPNAKDQDGLTPLHAAVLTSDAEMVRVLTRLGADPNARTHEGWSPLHIAAMFDAELATIRALVEAGADVNPKDKDGWTALHFAALRSSSPEAVLLLLQLGADANAKALDGSTPWDLIQENEKLRNSSAYWKLNDLRFR